MLSAVAAGGLGYVFWALTARYHNASAVGSVSAEVSSITFLATVGSLNLTSIFARFLPVAGWSARRLILLSYGAVALTGLLAAVVFLTMPLSTGLVHGGGFGRLAFTGCVVVNSVFNIQDGGLVGFGRFGWVPLENVLVASARLALLALAATFLSTSIGVMWSWALPMAVAVVVVNVLILGPLAREQAKKRPNLPRFGELGRLVAIDSTTTAVYAAVTTFLPALVTIRLGASQGGYFYVPWVITTMVGLLLTSILISMVREAVAHPEKADFTIRRSIRLVLLVITVVMIVCLLMPRLILAPLGPSFAVHGTSLLRWAGLAMPATAVIVLFWAACLVRRRPWPVFAVNLATSGAIVGGVLLLGRDANISYVGMIYCIAQWIAAAAVSLPTIRMLQVIRTRSGINMKSWKPNSSMRKIALAGPDVVGDAANSANNSMGLRSPVRVAVVDVAGTLSDLDCTRPSTPPYTRAWILVCRSGRPLGSITIPVNGALITAGQLERELRCQFGEAGTRISRGDTAALARASVVIPSNFARPAKLRKCVERLAELDYPDYEVIVVDNRPEGVPPIDVPGARVVREPRPGISAARNRGIAVATGEIIAFTDDDVVADRRWLRALGERFVREPDVAAVIGLVVPLELETQAQIFFEQSNNGLDRCFAPLTFEYVGRFKVVRRVHGSAAEQIRSIYLTGEFGPGSNMAFRTKTLRDMGGFDEALGVGTPTCGGEDVAMLIEMLIAGNRLGYEPDAIVQHSHRATLAELERQIHGYGIGFTAMLAAITLRNPRHALGLAATLPVWLRSLHDPSSAKNAHRTRDFPPALARAELRGMLSGPFVYLRTRHSQRQRTL